MKMFLQDVSSPAHLPAPFNFTPRFGLPASEFPALESGIFSHFLAFSTNGRTPSDEFPELTICGWSAEVSGG